VAPYELPLAPDVSTRLCEGSSPLDRLGSLDPQALGHVQSNEAVGIHIAVDQRSQPAQILFGHLIQPGWFRSDILNHQGLNVCKRDLQKVESQHGQLLIFDGVG
jgi:hypothetical protein